MKNLYLIFFAICFLTIKTQAQAKWNCGVNGSANVVAVFDGDTQTLTISGKGKMGDGSPWGGLSEAIKIVKINLGVTTIGENAFDGLKNLETVTIANSVTDIGDLAFYGAESLHKINIPNSVTNIGISAFKSSGLESISLPFSVKNIQWFVFSNCSLLKTADLSKTQLSYLQIGAFNNSEKLENVYLPKQIKSIDIRVFYNCVSLKSITCYSLTPPNISKSTFTDSIAGGDMIPDISTLTLYVPESSINIYKYSDVWKDFGKIEAIPTR